MTEFDGVRCVLDPAANISAISAPRRSFRTVSLAVRLGRRRVYACSW
jgi:hypothetical protein